MIVEPFLFSADPALVRGACDPARPPAERAGAVVVDWEQRGKAQRQMAAERRIGTDTQIGTDTAEDLARVRASVMAPVICRINQPGPTTAAEVDLAVRLGADEILVPMVRRVVEVEGVLRDAAGRVGVGILIETVDAVDRARDLGRLPLCRVYVGLMDLALDRATPSIFTALADGTVERVREQIGGPFGFGGLTVPGRGNPVPVDLLLAEMTRLDCAFSFLRRAFTADVAGGDAGAGVAAIRRAARAAADRAAGTIEADHGALLSAVARLDGHQLSRSTA